MCVCVEGGGGARGRLSNSIRIPAVPSTSFDTVYVGICLCLILVLVERKREVGMTFISWGADKGRRGMTSETLRLPPNLYMTEKDGKRWCGDLGHLMHVPSTLCYVASILNPKLTKKVMFEM